MIFPLASTGITHDESTEMVKIEPTENNNKNMTTVQILYTEDNTSLTTRQLRVLLKGLKKNCNGDDFFVGLIFCRA